jgi:hypothetical protein
VPSQVPSFGPMANSMPVVTPVCPLMCGQLRLPTKRLGIRIIPISESHPLAHPTCTRPRNTHKRVHTKCTNDILRTLCNNYQKCANFGFPNGKGYTEASCTHRSSLPLRTHQCTYIVSSARHWVNPAPRVGITWITAGLMARRPVVLRPSNAIKHVGCPCSQPIARALALDLTRALRSPYSRDMAAVSLPPSRCQSISRLAFSVPVRLNLFEITRDQRVNFQNPPSGGLSPVNI